MSRPSEIRRLRPGLTELPAGHCSVTRRYPRRHAIGYSVDGNGIRRAVDLAVLARGHHLREIQGLGEGGGQRAADQAAGVADHEGRFFGGKVLSRADEVAFIFARRGIEDDDEGAGF